MTVGEIKKVLENFDDNLEVFTQKKEVFGNIGIIFGAKLDTYSSFGKIFPCVLITDDMPDEEDE